MNEFSKGYKEQDYSKRYMEKQTRIAKTNSKKRGKVGGISLLDFKTCYITTVIKNWWC